MAYGCIHTANIARFINKQLVSIISHCTDEEEESKMICLRLARGDSRDKILKISFYDS